MKRFFTQLTEQLKSVLFGNFNDFDMENDPILTADNQKVYEELEAELKAIRPTDEELNQSISEINEKLRMNIRNTLKKHMPNHPINQF